MTACCSRLYFGPGAEAPGGHRTVAAALGQKLRVFRHLGKRPLALGQQIVRHFQALFLQQALVVIDARAEGTAEVEADLLAVDVEMLGVHLTVHRAF